MDVPKTESCYCSCSRCVERVLLCSQQTSIFNFQPGGGCLLEQQSHHGTSLKVQERRKRSNFIQCNDQKGNDWAIGRGDDDDPSFRYCCRVDSAEERAGTERKKKMINKKFCDLMLKVWWCSRFHIKSTNPLETQHSAGSGKYMNNLPSSKDMSWV